MDWVVFLLFVLGLVVVLATILPLWRTTRWWVRIWDFPRFQIALLALLVLVVTPLLRPPTNLFDWLFLGSLLGVVIWQATWVGPYLPGAPRAVQSKARNESDLNRVALLTTNVLQTSRGAHRLLEIIGDVEADLILAVEVDEWWTERLKDGLRSRYPYDICYPLSNEYGLALFSRLELVEPEVRFILDDAIPSDTNPGEAPVRCLSQRLRCAPASTCNSAGFDGEGYRVATGGA